MLIFIEATETLTWFYADVVSLWLRGEKQMIVRGFFCLFVIAQMFNLNKK